MSRVQHLSLDLSKLLNSSQVREVESIKVHESLTERRGPPSDVAVSPKGVLILSSATERIVRSRNDSHFRRKVITREKAPADNRDISTENGIIEVVGIQGTFQDKDREAHSGLRKSSPLRTLENAVIKEQASRALTLSKYDVLPPTLGSALEFNDSVGDSDSHFARKKRGGRHQRTHHQSRLSFMSSLSDNFSTKNSMFSETPAAGPRMVTAVVEDLPFDSFAFPSVTKSPDTMSSVVERRDFRFLKAQAAARDREYQDYQLVKQLHNGASIMRGVTYRRGAKGSNIAQRYQANLEKIIFIKNVYSQGHWRDSYLRRLERGRPQQKQMSAEAMAKAMLQEASMMSGVHQHQFSFIHGPRDNADGSFSAEYDLRSMTSHEESTIRTPKLPIIHVPMLVPQSVLDDEQTPVPVQQVPRTQEGNQETTAFVPVRPQSLPLPSSATSSGQSPRKHLHVRYTPSSEKTPRSASSRIGSGWHPPGTSDEQVTAKLLQNLPTSELLPSALNLDPTKHVFSPDKQLQHIEREQLRARYKFDEQDVSSIFLPVNASTAHSPSQDSRTLPSTAKGGGRSLDLASALFLYPAPEHCNSDYQPSADYSRHETFLSPQLRRRQRDAQRTQRKSNRKKMKPSLIGRGMFIQAVAVVPNAIVPHSDMSGDIKSPRSPHLRETRLKSPMIVPPPKSGASLNGHDSPESTDDRASYVVHPTEDQLTMMVAGVSLLDT